MALFNNILLISTPQIIFKYNLFWPCNDGGVVVERCGKKDKFGNKLDKGLLMFIKKIK